MRFDIGIDIGGTGIKLGVVDDQGRVVERCLLATQARKGPRQALVRISQTVNRLRQGRRVRSVGVGVAGLVDHDQGIVRVPPNLPGWNGASVKDQLKELTGLPVFCGNDVNAVTLGEWLYGAGRGCRNFVCVTLGTGVGGGVVAGGRLILGANHAAGEIGHTSVVPNGPGCHCGGRGCVERYVGSAYFVARARARLRAQLRKLNTHRNQTTLFAGFQSTTPSLILELVDGDSGAVTPREVGIAARRGDQLALELVEETGRYLGMALANVVEIIDPERIVIGGGMSRLGTPLLKAVRRTVLERIQTFPGRRLDVVRSRLGSDAGVVGAVCFARARARFSR
ncbi:MAG: ROK family protein [candidate division WOR-3 bacterium]